MLAQRIYPVSQESLTVDPMKPAANGNLSSFGQNYCIPPFNSCISSQCSSLLCILHHKAVRTQRIEAKMGCWKIKVTFQIFSNLFHSITLRINRDKNWHNLLTNFFLCIMKIEFTPFSVYAVLKLMITGNNRVGRTIPLA